MNINKLQIGEGGRSSNLEALRIVAMCMIVIHHFFLHAIHLNSTDFNLYLLVNPFVYAGVNLFFLISGYFLIKLNVKSLLKLVLMIAFFRIVVYGLCVSVGDVRSLRWIIINAMLPISRSPYWFLKAYLGLMIISPIVNAGLKSLSDRALLYSILTFSAFTFYSCFLGKNLTNDCGLTFGQGLYIYTLGYCIRRFEPFLSNIKPSLFFCAALTILALTSAIGYTFKNLLYMSYHSPLMVLASVLIFLGFSRLSFSSRAVNSIAGASLGVYMLQDSDFGFSFFYNWLHGVWTAPDATLIRWGVFAGVFFGLWIASWVLTWIYNRLFTVVIAPCIAAATERSRAIVAQRWLEKRLS